MIGYLTGKYDILRAKDLRNLDKMSQINRLKGNKYFAVVVYSNELCEEMGIGTPLKSAEDRVKIMEQINGVDFAFVVDSNDSEIINKCAIKAYNEYNKKAKEKVEENKEYETVYVPGTYDLFHAGHLENLLEACKLGKKVIVGVKSDELVKRQKGDYPKINAEERMEILRHFKFVDNVYEFYTRDLHIAAEWVKERYNSIPAIVCGADLEKDYKNINDLDIFYTDRDATKMKERSTSTYKKKLQLKQVRVPKEETHYIGKISLVNESAPIKKIDLDTELLKNHFVNYSEDKDDISK